MASAHWKARRAIACLGSRPCSSCLSYRLRTRLLPLLPSKAACLRPSGGSVPGRACPCPQRVCIADVVRFARCTAQQVPLWQALAWPPLLVPDAAVLGRSAAQWPHPAPSLPRQPKEGTGAAALVPVRLPASYYGGARRTRHGRGLACSVVAACPHTPRRSLRSAVGRTVFYCRAVCCRAPVAGRVLLPLTACRGRGDHGGGRPLAAARGGRLLRCFSSSSRRAM